MPGSDVEKRSEERVDVETHERKAGVFWGLCSVLVACFTAAAAPGTAIVQPGGLAFVLAYLVANLAYAVRIALGADRGDTERLGAASLVTAGLGVQQYLAGDLQVLAILAPLFVLGAVAVLEHRQRLLFLPVVIGTALSPLLYVTVDVRSVVQQVTLMVVLVLEMGLLGDYGDRLRHQRRRLAEAEAISAERAVTDELTGLENRRALVERVTPTATTEVEATTVLYCDLDGFKPFNDRFGHAAGDALLRRFGRALSTAATGHGVAYRVGGDEFCVVLDGRQLLDDPLVADLVGSLTEDGMGYRVRCSYGLASAPDDAVDLAGALQVADQRMYLIKRERRRRGERSASRVSST